MTHHRHALAAAALALLTAGCGTPAESAGGQAVPVERPATATPTPTLATPAVGGKQTSADSEASMDVTVLRLRLPFETTPPGMLERKGYEYAAIEVKACVTRNTAKLPVGVTWAPWSLAYESGVVVDAASSYSAEWFDEPLYPQQHIVRVGRCVRGWIPFEVRAKDGRPEVVAYTPSVGEALEWRVAGS